MTEWRNAKTDPPAKDGKYLCCAEILAGRMRPSCLILNYTLSLASVDAYDFSYENRPGWYGYDGEWGYYEIEDVTHWMPLPDPPNSAKEEY